MDVKEMKLNNYKKDFSITKEITLKNHKIVLERINPNKQDDYLHHKKNNKVTT